MKLRITVDTNDLNATTTEAIPDVPPAALAGPTNLVVRQYAEAGILINELIWTDNSSDELTFEIQRDDDASGDDFSPLATVPENHGVYLDRNILASLTYRYRVRAVAGARLSPWSNVATPEPWVPPVPPTPPTGRTKVSAGFNFAGKTGKYLLGDGVYPIFEPEDALDLKAEHTGRATFKAAAGKANIQHRGASNCLFDGITFEGGGTDTTDNMAAAVQPGRGWKLIDCDQFGALGVGLAINKVANCSLTRVKSHNNGRAGLGGSGCTDALLTNCENFENNVARQGTDGSSKFTRTRGFMALNHSSHDNAGPGIWFDISNYNPTLVGGAFFNNKPIKKNGTIQNWGGPGIMSELSYGFTVEGAKVYGNHGAQIEIDETTDPVISAVDFGPGVGPDDPAIRLRYLKRDDGDWKLSNVLVQDCTGTGEIWRSPASNQPVSISRTPVKIVNSPGLVNKVPA